MKDGLVENGGVRNAGKLLAVLAASNRFPLCTCADWLKPEMSFSSSSCAGQSLEFFVV